MSDQQQPSQVVGITTSNPTASVRFHALDGVVVH